MPDKKTKGQEKFAEYLRANPPMAAPTPPAPLAWLAERAAPFWPAPSTGTIVQVPTPGQGGRYRGYADGLDGNPDVVIDGKFYSKHTPKIPGYQAGTWDASWLGGNEAALEGVGADAIGGAEKAALDVAKTAITEGNVAGNEAGAAVGSAAGTAIGTAFGGPLGGAIGGAIGSAGGDALGGALGGRRSEFKGWLKDGTMKVPAPLMGYAEGKLEGDNYFAKEEERKAALSPEEWQREWLEANIADPVAQKLEAAPTYVQAPLAAVAAAGAFNKGDLPLGKLAGGKLYGGREGVRFEHGKYGDFEVGPDRVGWKKTWRW